MCLPQGDWYNLVLIRGFPIVVGYAPCLQARTRKTSGVSAPSNCCRIATIIHKTPRRGLATQVYFDLEETCIVCCDKELVLVVGPDIHDGGTMIMVSCPETASHQPAQRSTLRYWHICICTKMKRIRRRRRLCLLRRRRRHGHGHRNGHKHMYMYTPTKSII
jgi:hypothetical protein